MSEPIFQKSPPDETPCHPILLLGLPEWVLEEMRHIFIHDIVFSTRATFGVNHRWELDTCLHMLNNLDGKSLVSIARVFGGPVIVDEDVLFVSTDDYECSINEKIIDQLSQGDMQYQAIVMDEKLINNQEIATFVGKQYHNCDTSVMIMALECVPDLNGIHEIFGVPFEMLQPTHRFIDLSCIGKSTIGEKFALKSYTKANFNSVPHELFVEVVNPEDVENVHEDDSEFEDDHEDESELEDDSEFEGEHEDDSEFEDDSDYEALVKAAPRAIPFSHFDGSKFLSLLFHDKSVDINIGAVILRLCYASMNRA